MSVSSAVLPVRRLRLGFIGWGAIAARVGELLAARDLPGVEIVAVAVRDPDAARAGLPAGARLLHGPEDLAGLDLDLVIEAAGRPAVAIWGEAALWHAGAFAVSSTSAFCDDALFSRLLATARETGGQLIVPPGALGGMDALAAASALELEAVTHTITKPPRAWAGTPAEACFDPHTLAERLVFFSGTAREAADRFPQNANVAVISALAGLGLERTRIELVADPAATLNSHAVAAHGAFGRLDVRLENEPLPDNPKSSQMTALSLLRLIENRTVPLVF
ncbi:aspartate dehydrogenase [Stappia taiwanensis]|uniref:L-aspartate dehydrogenase n=1 Tax=Stappia taiwanensis TaxID=992267 RepID=A0A838XS90_9HYPH|nr:aspartate dehydrogenase [Stappia taiwanensis]MBA4611931.1 aspartate dehydrogenase [Stappia taiwanensis]GGF03867.1 putative L-aspartate dehydrogenase [Stappia taiwanensis]